MQKVRDTCTMHDYAVAHRPGASFPAVAGCVSE
jgi:hypothetical protein